MSSAGKGTRDTRGNLRAIRRERAERQEYYLRKFQPTKVMLASVGCTPRSWPLPATSPREEYRGHWKMAPRKRNHDIVAGSYPFQKKGNPRSLDFKRFADIAHKAADDSESNADKP